MSNLEYKKMTLSDLEFIYDLMMQDFPIDELKSYSQLEKIIQNNNYQGFKIYLDNKFISFIFIFFPENIDYIWLDYFSVLKEFRNLGYGSKILSSIKEKFKSGGIFLELDIPEHENSMDKRRINFYERNSGYLLKNDYLFPLGNKKFIPMYLYYIPVTETKPGKNDVLDIISQSQEIIHSDCIELLQK